MPGRPTPPANHEGSASSVTIEQVDAALLICAQVAIRVAFNQIVKDQTASHGASRECRHVSQVASARIVVHLCSRRKSLDGHTTDVP